MPKRDEVGEAPLYSLDHIRMTDLKESERPREKLLTHGPRALSDAELMAIQLGTGLQGTNALQLAHLILESADNNLYRLYESLRTGCAIPIKGVGMAKKANILACLELGMRTVSHKKKLDNEGKQLTNSQMIYDYIYTDLYNLSHEELWIVLFNQRLIAQRKIRISKGGLTNSTADIRVILSTALRLELPALALVHNHPGGSLQPSHDDDDVTDQLYKACRLIGISMVVHVIFTDNGYYSYLDNGRLGVGL